MYGGMSVCDSVAPPLALRGTHHFHYFNTDSCIFASGGVCSSTFKSFVHQRLTVGVHTHTQDWKTRNCHNHHGEENNAAPLTPHKPTETAL